MLEERDCSKGIDYGVEDTSMDDEIMKEILAEEEAARILTEQSNTGRTNSKNAKGSKKGKKGKKGKKSQKKEDL